MKKVHVLVEGQTEERFVNVVLTPALTAVMLNPIIVATKRVQAGGKFRGGLGSYRQVRDDVQRLLRDSSASCVTTLFDLYGLPDDFPGQASTTAGTARARDIEQAMRADFSDARYQPHLSVYELETYLFVAPEKITAFSEREQQVLVGVRNSFAGEVERINDGETTHPSARIKTLHQGYDKVVDGPDALRETGVVAIAAACPHFKSWLSMLERL